MKTVLVTGASGFLGRCLVSFLLTAGYKLVLVGRQEITVTTKRKSIKLTDNKYDLPKLNNFHFDYMLHLATDYGNGSNRVENTFNANVLLPLNILEIINRNSDFLVFTCDTFYSKFYDIKKNCLYTQSKRILLEAVQCIDKNLNLLNGRIEHMYGEGDSHKKFIPYVIDKLKNDIDLNLTECKHKRDFIEKEQNFWRL